MDFAFIERFVSDCKSDIVGGMAFFQKYIIYSGFCIFFSILILMLVISDHLSNWERPHEQKKILPIILIPSIQAIASFLALYANEDSKTLFLVLDALKECSVGLGLALFLSLLYTYMDINTTQHSETDIRLKIGGRAICNVFPATLFQPRYVLLNQNNPKTHKYWTWQFVVIRLVCSIFMIVLQLLDMYPPWLSWAFFFLLNVSVSLAFYTLVAFYQAFNKDFTDDMDFAKLVYFRGMVFVCFGQGGVLKVLVAMGIIKTNHFWRQELHNTLVMLEMLFFALFQLLAYAAAPRLRDFPVWSPNFAAPKFALPEVYTVARAA